MPNGIAIEIPDAAASGGRAGVRILIGLAPLVLVALAGYGTFLIYATMAPTLIDAGYLVVAVVAGAGAFFSPCSFPLLPSYLAYAQIARRTGEDIRRSRALFDGFAAAAGVVSFNGILGLFLGLAGVGIAQSFALLSPNPSVVTVGVRSMLGISLLVLGIAQVANISLHGGLIDRVVRSLQPQSQPREPLLRLYLYGFAYTLVGIGCTAPFLATVILVSFAAGGFLPAFGGFLTFSLTMAGLMILVSIVASSSQRHLLKGLSARTPAIKRAAGTALMVFGALLLVLTLWPALLRPFFP